MEKNVRPSTTQEIINQFPEGPLRDAFISFDASSYSNFAWLLRFFETVRVGGELTVTVRHVCYLLASRDQLSGGLATSPQQLMRIPVRQRLVRLGVVDTEEHIDVTPYLCRTDSAGSYLPCGVTLALFDEVREYP
jgi:hypothetical protein